MDLYVFNRDLEMLGVIDKFISLRWIRRYSKCGEFELHCSLTNETLNLLKKENIIYKKDDTEAAYIEYRNLKQNNDGSETIVVKGKFLTGYFNRRIIWGIENLNCTAEQAMRSLVEKNCINSNIKERIIKNLFLDIEKKYSESVNYQVSYKNLLEELENLSNLSEIGYRVNFNRKDKKVFFEAYKGVDRTINQKVNPQAIFSREFENILEQEYIESVNNYRNVALIAGEGEDADRKLITVGNTNGLDRFEVFIDARDITSKQYINNAEKILTSEEYNLLLNDRGNIRLAEFKQIETFDSKINIKSNLTYKVDFDLGDIVTCRTKKWGITVDTRITEIEEVYEPQGFSINAVFGNKVPTLIDKIKQKLK